MAQQELARVISNPTPSKGQKHRSSVNFSTENMPSGTKYISFAVDGGGTNINDIFFDVEEDISMGSDKMIYPNQSNGSRSSNVQKYGKLYIANPQGAVSDFEVIVYANW